MNKIQKVSSYFLAIFNVLLIGWPFLILFEWLVVENKVVSQAAGGLSFLFEKIIQTPEGTVDLASIHWTPFSLLTALTSEILGILSFILSFYFLRCIFQNYKKGEIFSQVNATYYKYLGCFFFLHALIFKPISGMLMILAVTLSNAPGHRYISISFGSPNLGALFCGAVIIVISWVMLEASKLQDEQALTI